MEREYRDRTRLAILLVPAEERRRLVAAMDLVERTLARYDF